MAKSKQWEMVKASFKRLFIVQGKTEAEAEQMAEIAADLGPVTTDPEQGSDAQPTPGAPPAGAQPSTQATSATSEGLRRVREGVRLVEIRENANLGCVVGKQI